MAGSIPASLKSADISRFVQRAAQVEKAKPVVAYWCYYWIVDQIVSRGLHNTDDESLAYTTTLMDKLEQMKADNAGNDAIVDDVAGQAYVEQFGLETFQRADNAVRANKASRQTADTFQASATFLDLLRIWGELDPEIASKIKFAKYHALRIAKAIKTGEDPNLSNPVPEPSPEQELPSHDLNDPQVQSLNGTFQSNARAQEVWQPSVEDAPDDHDRLQHSLAQRSSLDESLHPSRASSVPRHPLPYPSTVASASPSEHTHGEDYYTNAASGADVSPLESSSTDRKASAGGGYFPRVPAFTSELDAPNPPTAPPEDSSLSSTFTMPNSAFPPTSSSRASVSEQREFQPTNASQSFPSPPVNQSSAYNQPRSDQPVYQPHQLSVTPQLLDPNIQEHYRRHPLSQPQRPVRHPPTTEQATGSETFVANEEAILKAQKHARWAISALNFEDVKTAVKELRGALDSLEHND
ncbi:MAG: hypothetical protein M1830_002138 [Pleopsidium flavum]|nr:MAG: hypothetical protein M1830_002138 [Pleopsidium flavum]